MKRTQAFTLVELLVSIAVLSLLIVLFAQLLSSATTITTQAHKRMDSDSQSRPLLDRMASDFSRILKRTDVSYYFKNASTTMVGNDLVAFYSAAQGYFPTTPSTVSLVAYRINGDSSNSAAYNRLERMCKGLDWNGASATDVPIVFLPLTIDATWPCVASTTLYDDPTSKTYEVAGAEVFRFEYYYVEKATGSPVAFPVTWSSSSNIKLSDVTAIIAAIAVIDPKSRTLLSSAQMQTLAGTLPDYNSSMGPGQLLAAWQNVLDTTTTVPRPAISSVRLYERYFYLP
jgi:prepilin-type N-terminal cleavage/methylation domain-containing protein